MWASFSISSSCKGAYLGNSISSNDSSFSSSSLRIRLSKIAKTIIPITEPTITI